MPTMFSLSVEFPVAAWELRCSARCSRMKMPAGKLFSDLRKSLARTSYRPRSRRCYIPILLSGFVPFPFQFLDRGQWLEKSWEQAWRQTARKHGHDDNRFAEGFRSLWKEGNPYVPALTDYGAFIELEAGVEGLIHVSEMSWSKRVKHPSKILNVGDSVEAMVLGVDPTARRISLGLKQVEQNPWHDLAEKYPVGTRIKGRVRNLTEFGAFVEVEDDIDGLIHISDMSWSKRVKHPSEVLKKGDVVEAMVLNIDAENQRLSLGLKQLATDIWDDFFSRRHVGDTIEGKVVRMTNFGAFVELDEGIEGLIHVSEFDDRTHGGREDRAGGG